MKLLEKTAHAGDCTTGMRLIRISGEQDSASLSGNGRSCACASAAGACSRIRQSNFEVILL